MMMELKQLQLQMKWIIVLTQSHIMNYLRLLI